MARLRDLLQRLGRAPDPEDLERRQPVDAALDLADDGGEDLADELRLLGHEPVDVEREVGQVLAEVEQADAPVLVDVALADLDEAAGRREHGDALRDRVAGKRVQDDVDAAAARRLQDLVREVERARVVHVLDAEGAQVRPLRVAASGRVDLRAELPCDLDRREADGARRRVDQDALAGLEAGEPDEREPGGGERDRDPGRRGRVDAGGARHDELRGRADVRAEAPVAHRREHGIAGREPLDPGADRDDRAGALDPEPVGVLQLAQRERGQQVEREHDVAEVEPRGLDGDLDLAGPERRLLDLDQAHALEEAGRADLRAEAVAGNRRPRRRVPGAGVEPVQAGNEPSVAAQRHLLLVAWPGEQLGGERVELGVGRVGGEVDEPAAHVVALLLQRPAEPQQHSLPGSHRSVVVHRLRPGCDEHELGRRPAVCVELPQHAGDRGARLHLLVELDVGEREGAHVDDPVGARNRLRRARRARGLEPRGAAARRRRARPSARDRPPAARRRARTGPARRAAARRGARRPT